MNFLAFDALYMVECHSGEILTIAFITPYLVLVDFSGKNRNCQEISPACDCPRRIISIQSFDISSAELQVQARNLSRQSLRISLNQPARVARFFFKPS